MARPHSLTPPLRPAAPLALSMRARGANPSVHGRWQCDASGNAQGRGVESRAKQGEEEGRRETTREERGRERERESAGLAGFAFFVGKQREAGRQGSLAPLRRVNEEPAQKGV